MNNISSFPIKEMYSYCLQGNITKAMHLWKSFPEEKLSNEEKKLKRRYEERFGDVEQDGSGDVTALHVKPIIEMFQAYWHKVLLHNHLIKEADEKLKQSLAIFLIEQHVSSAEPTSAIMDDLASKLHHFLSQKGYNSNVLGRTIPFLDAFIWQKETETIFDVQLPETHTQVKVIFMDNFATQGWAHYATQGKYYASGWATQDTLYCVRKAYDIESEKFIVSYLTHEAQHFEDYRSFPKLQQTDLEYRAKLAELATAQTTIYSLLETFVDRAAYQKELPHPFAQYCVIRDLSQMIFHQSFVSNKKAWADIPIDVIRCKSICLLRQHTERLRAKGAETVTEYIA